MHFLETIDLALPLPNFLFPAKLIVNRAIIHALVHPDSLGHPFTLLMHEVSFPYSHPAGALLPVALLNS